MSDSAPDSLSASHSASEASSGSVPLTVIVAVRNEASNIAKCLESLKPAERVVVVDSHSSDMTCEIAAQFRVDVVQFTYAGGFPKKRQWALENVGVETSWTLLLDADEEVPDELWQEIVQAIFRPDASDGYLIEKGFCFLGRRFRFGGFSHSALLLFKTGCARFERLGDLAETGFDMEIHERLIVNGKIDRLRTPLIHKDLKGLAAYIDRHNRYSTWEAAVRYRFKSDGDWGEDCIEPRLIGNSQERRRFLKQLVCRLPGEHWLWFCWHYLVRLGFLEGRAGLIACRLRSQYIADVNAKLVEMHISDKLRQA